MLSILTIIGARPQFIKASPVSQAMKNAVYFTLSQAKKLNSKIIIFIVEGIFKELERAK